MKNTLDELRALCAKVDSLPVCRERNVAVTMLNDLLWTHRTVFLAVVEAAIVLRDCSGAGGVGRINAGIALDEALLPFRDQEPKP